jgi:hypothetical protein
MRTLACLALLTGCAAHSYASSAPEMAASEPTVDSKIGDAYNTAGVPSTQPAPPPPTRQMEVMAVAARAPGAMEMTGDAIAGLFRKDKREENLEAPEPDPNRRRPEKVVVEAWVTLVTDEVQPIAQQIRDRVAQLNGRVTEDRVGGAASQSWEGNLKVRLPPETVPAFLDWLAGRGEMVSRRVSATDVSRQYFDHQIALHTLELTLQRLQKIMEQGGKIDEVLHIEQEMTRVRTQIEQLKGALRFMDDTVSFSTIDIRLTGTRPIPHLVEEKFHIGGRLDALTLTDPAGREGTRWGGGAVLMFNRSFSFDLDGFSSVREEGPTVLATLGGAAYTDFLGGGTRKVGNPYLGVRMGYARLDHNDLFLLSAEVGVEIVHFKYLIAEAFIRPTALLGDSSDLALHWGGGLSVPF